MVAPSSELGTEGAAGALCTRAGGCSIAAAAFFFFFGGEARGGRAPVGLLGRVGGTPFPTGVVPAMVGMRNLGQLDGDLCGGDDSGGDMGGDLDGDLGKDWPARTSGGGGGLLGWRAEEELRQPVAWRLLRRLESETRRRHGWREQDAGRERRSRHEEIGIQQPKEHLGSCSKYAAGGGNLENL